MGDARRLAAVMFTDIVGFTAVTQRDEALALRLLEEHRAILRPLFVQYNGHEIKTIGDAFLVEFDSALDAARCGVDAQRLLHERNTHVAGEPIELRIGLHVGDVIHQENDAYGDAVNVASRIHGLAEPGGICLSEPVASQLRGKLGLPLERLPPTQLKNVAQPMELYRVGLPWTEGGVSLTTPWVDRDTELATAHRLLTRALRGEGAVLLLTGEAGVGKSRLAEETAEAAVRGGGQVLRGRCSQGELSAPYAPWVEAIREFVREAPRQQLYKVLGSYGGEVARLVPEVVEKVGAVPANPPSDPERALLQFLDGIAGFFSNLATEAPVLLLLDDLQWADSASVTLLLFLARRLHARPILLVGAFREDAAEENVSFREAVSQLNRERLATLVPLGRFDAERVGEMIAKTFHEPDVSEEFARLLHDRTGGNPFFVEEVLRALVRDGVIHWTNSGWDRKPVTEIELPKALKELIASRLKRLDETSVDALRLASVIGYEFEFDLLQAVSGLEEGTLLDALERALKSGLVRESERPGRRVVYLFADHQIRDALYGEISLVRRRRLHLKVAQAMESSKATASAERPDALAFHFLHGNDSEKALTYSLRAAERAGALFAHEESYRHYLNALELAEELDALERKASILLGLGQSAELLGRGKEAVRRYREAASVYDQLGARRARGEALTNAGAAELELVGDLALARQLSHEAVEILESEGESRELAIGYVNLGYLLTENGEIAEARRLLEAGLPLTAKFGLPNERTIALQFLAMTSPLEEVPQAIAQLREAAEIAQRENALRAATKWANLGGTLARVTSDFGQALENVDRAVKEGTRRGVAYFVRYAHAVEMFVRELRGEWPRAIAIAKELAEPHTEEPSLLVALASAHVLARIEYRQGHRDSALLYAHRALDFAERIDQVSETALAMRVLAWDALDARTPATVRDRLEELRRRIHDGGVVLSNVREYVELLSVLIDVDLALDSTDHAGREVREVEEIASRVRQPWFEAVVPEVQGRLARAEGDTARAEQLFGLASDRWEALGLPYEAARARADHARVLEAMGRTDDAQAARERARPTFEALQALPDLARLDEGRSPVQPAAPAVARPARAQPEFDRGSV